MIFEDFIATIPYDTHLSMGMNTRRYRRYASPLATASVLLSAVTRFSMGGYLDDIGVTSLRAVEPGLNGTGVTVIQAEANTHGANSFEVSPSAAGLDPSIFTYVDDNGNGNGTFNAAGESGHADSVAGYFYASNGSASSPGIAWGVSHVFNISADYYTSGTVPNLTPVVDASNHPVPIVNQSFIETGADGSPLTALDQEAADLAYDNYIATYGTLMISAVGNAGAPNSPGTAYNGIGVAAINGSSSSGPTIDTIPGRAKPDIAAQAGYTSFATPQISGCAVLLYQAGLENFGGAGTSSDATDARTIKALLLNGAVKTANWSRSSTAPLDDTVGAGWVNVYNSFEQLSAHEQAPTATSMVATGSISHPGVSGSAATNIAGWNLEHASGFSSTQSQDVYQHYIIAPGAQAVTYTLTATLDWFRPVTQTYSANAINNLSLYLYDVSANSTTAVDQSISTVDNVQHLYDIGLTPGHTYDLEVGKRGGAIGSQGVLSNSETYAIAYSFAPVIETLVWNNSGSAGDGTNWDSQNSNFKSGTGVATFTDGSAVTFNDNCNSHYMVDVSQNVNPASVTFANNQGNYVIAGNGQINGGGSLNVSGTGSVTLSNANNYAGGTNILGLSTLIIDAAGALPSSGAVFNNGNLVIDATTTTDTIRSTGQTSVIGGASLTVNSFEQGVLLNNGNTIINAIGTIEQVGGMGALRVNSNAVVSVAILNQTSLLVDGTLTVSAGGSAASVSGAGVLALGKSGTVAGTFTLNRHSGLQINTIGSIAIAPGAALDITNSALQIAYASRADPSQLISQYIADGYNNGKWNGIGINSFLAAADPSHYGVGYADSADPGNPAGLPDNTEEARYTVLGDTNLDGMTTYGDYQDLVLNFGHAGGWDQGDFNYDGMVNFADYQILLLNYGAVANLSADQLQAMQATALGFGYSLLPNSTGVGFTMTAVPEPASWLALAVTGFLATIKRPGRSHR